jgi:hypothetical protein
MYVVSIAVSGANQYPKICLGHGGSIKIIAPCLGIIRASESSFSESPRISERMHVIITP